MGWYFKNERGGGFPRTWRVPYLYDDLVDDAPVPPNHDSDESGRLVYAS